MANTWTNHAGTLDLYTNAIFHRSLPKAGSLCAGLALIASLPFAASAETNQSLNAYGVPGLIDTPTAHSLRDADLATTFAVTGDTLRATLTFQIAPRLMGSFRYSSIRNFDNPASVDEVYYDRSFDIRYQLLNESQYLPGVVVGLQDFLGTGLYESEYIVASKTVTSGLVLSAGLGWGRLGSVDPIATTGERPRELLGEGGIPNYDRWFRGDLAMFGGVSYSPNDRLTFKLEYAPDNYTEERLQGEFNGSSQWNAGVDVKFRNGGQLSLYSMYGDTYGLQYSIVTNPRRTPAPSRLDPAPLPVAVRSAASLQDLNWSPQDPKYRQTLAGLIKTEGMQLEGMTLEANKATVRINNLSYFEVPQAVGRTARAMSRVLPGSIETFVIIPTDGTVPLSAVTLRRSDLEALEHEKADEIYARAQITDSFGLVPPLYDGLYPKFTWSLAPEFKFSAFDPEAPIRTDLALALRGSYRPSPNWLVSGAVTGSLAGNLDDIDREDDSALPAVRTNRAEYARNTDVGISELTVNHFGRPGKNLYSRITLGYLETMYGGASAELLWKPVDSKLALGIEVNAVKQRAYDGGFDFRDYETVTGHVSAYYDFGKGYVGRIDAGRYLAEDWGATIGLDREFPNGWRIGGYATFTDVSAEDFGEGSFDKGIRISIPTSQGTARASRNVSTFNIQSLSRDGGARVNVSNRLYDRVKNGHDPAMAKSWGRFWR